MICVQQISAAMRTTGRLQLESYLWCVICNLATYVARISFITHNDR